MEPAAFARLRAIVLSVASAPPERREEVLVRECGEDGALRATVLRLLEFDPGESELDGPERRSGGVGLLTASILTELGEAPPPPGGAEALDDPGELASLERPPTADAIPGYHIIRKLGEGGMGAVYLAEDVKLARRVALKFLRRDLVVPGTLTRFIHEARAAAAIDHPNICTVYGIHEAEGRAFIAMAYVEGMTLRQRIASGPLPVDRTIEIGLQIARGLRVTHEKGIIHRDLKPSNVMLSADGTVKIVDFGIAQSRDRLSVGRGGARMGTISYMSPEQLRGEHVDHRADTWALGVVLFEMLSGRLPFGGDSDQTLSRHIVHDEPLRLAKIRDDVPAPLRALIGRCLSKEPAGRPDAVEIARVLEPLRPSSLTVRGIRRHGGWILAATAFATLVVLVAVAGSWRGWFGAGRETGPPRAHLTRLTVLPQDVGGALLPGALSPDGRSLALPLRHLRGDWATIGVFSIETGQTRYIDMPQGEAYSVGWMPDGETLLTFEYRGDLPWRQRRFSDDSRTQIWLRNITTNQGRRLYEHPHYTEALWPVASPDGAKIAMFRGNLRGLWVMDTSGGEPRKIREVPAGEQIHSLIWSPSGSRVAYVRSLDDAPGGLANIETCDLEGTTHVILGGLADLDPGQNYVALCWLPDGRLIFTRYANFLRTRAALWSIRVDPATGVRDGAPVQLAEMDGAALGQPTASADGRRLAFYRWQANLRPSLLELDADGDSVGVGRWTSQNWPAMPGAWTRRGRKLFFSVEASNGDCDIYAQDMETGLAEPVAATPKQDYVACLTPGGSDLLFWQGNRLERMPLDGGGTVEIFRSSTPVNFLWDAIERVMCSNEPGSRCVFKRVEGDSTAFYGFDPRDGSLHEELARVGFRLQPPSGRCDLSPDGTRIAIVAKGALWMLELDDQSIRKIEAEWRGVPESVSWSGDGTWLCVVGVAGEAGSWVRRVDLDGHSTVLWRSDEVGALPITVLSPDGSGVPLTVVHGETDVWMLEND